MSHLPKVDNKDIHMQLKVNAIYRSLDMGIKYIPSYYDNIVAVT